MDWPPPADWPMQDYSRRVLCRPHRWHVQEAGEGPTLILIHGAGGATQSWRGLFPILTERFHVVAMDLPGQGFTASGAQRRHGLEPMAADLQTLLDHQGWAPAAVIGHSAGAALALQMARSRPVPAIIGINAALGQFKGVAGWLFPMLAKALALTPFSASLFAQTTSQSSTQSLIKGTGSTLDKRGISFYKRLSQDRAHVDGTLSMMAQWDLDPLLAALDKIAVPTHLLVGDGDRAVPPATSHAAAGRLPHGHVRSFPGLGHLAHEEEPATIAAAICEILNETGPPRDAQRPRM